MKHQSKLNSEQQQRQQAAEHQAQSKPALEFGSAEELLRYDAAHTEMPGGIEQRLQASAAPLPRPGRPWWKRLFGG
jgi:hypothetical protein